MSSGLCLQVVNVSLPGQAPALMEAKEDTRLLQQELGGKAGGCEATAADHPNRVFLGKGEGSRWVWSSSC